MSDWEGPLDALRWHWDSAYLISFFEPDNWVAQRRDNRETLRAGNPVDLRDLIVADYNANPVSRSVAPGRTARCRLAAAFRPSRAAFHAGPRTG